MSRTHAIVAASNQPIIVELTSVDTGLAINLTGITSPSAKAWLADGSGSAISFTAAAVEGDATDGTIKLSFATGTFTTLGTYALQIQYTDAAGKIHIYPSDGDSLRFTLKEQIT